METQRVDKWLWAARFFKTRALATEAVQRGHVQLGTQDIKPAREIHMGQTLRIRQGEMLRTVVIRGLSLQRGSAPVAQQLYEETAESIAQGLALAERRRLAPEPAHSIEHGRPSKKDRRDLQRTWDARWSAALDD